LVRGGGAAGHEAAEELRVERRRGERGQHWNVLGDRSATGRLDGTRVVAI
jgi:hypothetical protein